MLAGKKILLGITGSIAAYKSILLVRLLVKAGAEVRVIITPGAKDFVPPLVLSTLSGNKVLVDLFDEDSWSNHVMLGRWADVMLIAPLSCNTLAKMANGQCDNLLLAVYLSATCPVIAAPAMDEDMWRHPATRANILKLEGYSNHVINVGTGELASGLVGEGRMAEPEQILQYLTNQFFRGTALRGKRAVVTAGPTYEAIDPVRFIGNHSSGKMGFAIAEALYRQGAEVHLIAGPVKLAHIAGVKRTDVTSAGQMHSAAREAFKDADIAVMSAAVADYTPVEVAAEKIKKTDGGLTLNLHKTRDILKSLGEVKANGQLLVGFALETNNEKENALQKLKQKNADLIVLNSLRDSNAGFGYDTNKVTIFDKEGNTFETGLLSKQQVAEEIVQIIIQKLHAKTI
ncbi:bifunctional phosphopantothenoylcysteine decarboxylase/phosphopantothenate--cysteine ligase CoaBC [Foetidibacter luteolus]|uniref:bifunctional phosphopantothenoylcysteine decarboxylase/phosphopantothenate--cysteine ligase CoaBC n=1 Tax=Foetidibacter luteolus TaxID=2608880 RepID=UPI00129A2356|nr:bifunctional phosphopantothenoylcysteine decarboxylase/phosphopantothenate--cysteine ligase CoaBC [Foetidibacter luteolus]